MLELPNTMRTLLVEQLDEYCERLDDTSDTASIAEAVVETVESVAQEVTVVDAEEIIAQIETSGELEASLIEVLEDALNADSGFEYSGESLILLIEHLCELEWMDADEDDEAAGFFGGDVSVADEDY